MTGFVVGLVLLVVWAALYLARFKSHDIEGWQVVKVLKVAEPKKVESQEVIDEMLSQHKAAPGAAKAMLLAVVGENESSLTPEAWQKIVELAKHDNGALLRGTKVGFNTYTKQTRDSKKTIHPVRFTHIEQTDEEIEANAKRYTK